MRRKWTSFLAAAALSVCGMPAWAQDPLAAELGLPAAVVPAPPAEAALIAPVCDTACPDDCATGYFTVGAGMYFIMPFFSNNATGVVTSPFAPNKTGGFDAAQQNYGAHVSEAPLAWLGYTFANGWGVRGRWFEFIGDTTAVAGFDPTADTTSLPLAGTTLDPGEKFVSTRSLHLDVFDLEATNNFVWGRWAMLGSFGVRYAHISSAVTNSLIEPDGTNLASASASSTFSGVGPTMALEARRRIADSDFFLYGSGRGSILCGTLHQTNSLSGAVDEVGVVPAARDPGVTDNITSRSTTVLGIGEIELGGEWARVIGRVRVFAQVAFVGQIWVGFGAPNNNGFIDEDVFGLTSQSTNNFGFLGGVFRAGVSF